MTPSAVEQRESFTWMERLKGHIAILRIDHWTKNVFVLPGVVIPLTIHQGVSPMLIQHLILGMISVCLVASSNYVINEILDAPYDRLHPIKRTRPAALGLVSLPLGYAQWILLMLAGVGIGLYVSKLVLPYSAGAVDHGMPL